MRNQDTCSNLLGFLRVGLDHFEVFQRVLQVSACTKSVTKQFSPDTGMRFSNFEFIDIELHVECSTFRLLIVHLHSDALDVN